MFLISSVPCSVWAANVEKDSARGTHCANNLTRPCYNNDFYPEINTCQALISFDDIIPFIVLFLINPVCNPEQLICVNYIDYEQPDHKD